MDDAAARHLARCPRLTALDLEQSHVTDAAVAQLVTPPHGTAALARLGLAGCRGVSRELRAAAERGGAPEAARYLASKGAGKEGVSKGR